MKNAIGLVLVLLLLGAAGVASADGGRRHGHVRFGVTIGSPYWDPWFYPPHYYYPYHPPYYAPVIIERPEPQVYIEQQPAPATPSAASAAAAAGNYWYYCAAAKGYYPYVKECPSGWQRVSPQPPGQP